VPEASAHRLADAAEPPSARSTAPVVFHGPPGDLADLVADHVQAAGARLVRAGSFPPSEAALHVLAADALLASPSSFTPRTGIGPDPAPLIVVTLDVDVPAEVWHHALAIGAREVLPLPGRSADLLARIVESQRPPRRAQVIAVAGGCGGAGASSLAARLAGAARRHGAVVLVDADPFGGGLDLLVEAPEQDGARWEDLAGIESADGEALVAGLPVVDDVRLLTPRGADGVDAVLLERVLGAVRGITATVVVDLADHLVAPAAPLVDRLLVVVPTHDHALAAARRRLGVWPVPAPRCEIVLRGRGPVRPAEAEELLQRPVAGSYRDSPAGVVPLLDVRRRGADALARKLLAPIGGRGPRS
jgi:secretion/DNA translocation related CpaE-like protein